jgi:hypothetical protein
MFMSPTCRISEELFGNLLMDLEPSVLSLPARFRTLEPVCAFELVVPSRLFQQVLGRRQRVKYGWRIVAHHLLITIQVIPWPQLQPCTPVVIHAHQVNAIRRHSNGDLLDRAAVAFSQQRRLPALLRQTICRRDGQGLNALAPPERLTRVRRLCDVRGKLPNGFHHITPSVGVDNSFVPRRGSRHPAGFSTTTGW